MRSRLHGSATILFAVLLLTGLALLMVHWSDVRWMDKRLAALSPHSNPQQLVLSIFSLVTAQADSFDASRIQSPLQRTLATLEHASPFHLSARAVLLAGSDHIGFCGSLTRSMLVLLDRADIPARKVLLYDRDGVGVHTVLEVFLDGEWRILDPTYNWYWTRPEDGEIAGVIDLASGGSRAGGVEVRGVTRASQKRLRRADLVYAGVGPALVQGQ